MVVFLFVEVVVVVVEEVISSSKCNGTPSKSYVEGRLYNDSGVFASDAVLVSILMLLLVLVLLRFLFLLGPDTVGLIFLVVVGFLPVEVDADAEAAETATAAGEAEVVELLLVALVDLDLRFAVAALALVEIEVVLVRHRFLNFIQHLTKILYHRFIFCFHGCECGNPLTNQDESRRCLILY